MELRIIKYIEHFSGDLHKRVVDKICGLLKKGGKLILDVPNFNYGQYLLHSLLDRDNLKAHNIKTMNLPYYCQLAKENNLKIL